MGSQAWADGRTKTNVAPKNIHTLFFLVVGDNNSITPTPTTASRTTTDERKLRIYSSASIASKQVLVVIIVITVPTILAALAPVLAADLLVGDSQGWRLNFDYYD